MSEDPTFRVMRAAGWKWEPQSDGFRRAGLWVSRNQAQAAIAAAVNGREYRPSHGQSPEFNEIIIASEGTRQ